MITIYYEYFMKNVTECDVPDLRHIEVGMLDAKWTMVVCIFSSETSSCALWNMHCFYELLTHTDIYSKMRLQFHREEALCWWSFVDALKWISAAITLKSWDACPKRSFCFLEFPASKERTRTRTTAWDSPPKLQTETSKRHTEPTMYYSILILIKISRVFKIGEKINFSVGQVY